jgi:hypothetical protein
VNMSGPHILNEFRRFSFVVFFAQYMSGPRVLCDLGVVRERN